MVLFADIKSSMALLQDLAPGDARHLIDPALQIMMDGVPMSIYEVLGVGA